MKCLNTNERMNPLQPSPRLVWWSSLFVAAVLVVIGYLGNFVTEGLLAGIVVLVGILIFRDRQIRAKLGIASRIVENTSTILYRLAGAPSLPMTFISSNIGKLGYDPSEFLAASDLYRSLVHPEDRVRVAEFTQRLLEGGGSDSLQFRVRAKDGSYRWFDNQVTPL